MHVLRYLSFNSMKVRLKHKKSPVSYTYDLFQFHEGPIKTQRETRMQILHKSFNSMKVRLKPENIELLYYPIFSFNSMKVRLKPP